MASASASASSSSSLSSVVDLCSSSSAQTSDSSSSWNGSLWNDVDLAERFLISSQFDEAAAICSIILQKLKDVSSISEPPEQFEGIDGGIDEDEVEDMIESAGMVLIQAYSESGRSGMIFNDLETVFGCLAKVPPSMFLAGVCLQISAGLHLDAQMSLESFLQDWAFTSVGEESCMFKPTSKQNHGSICLKPETYIEITELYCVQVLAKGLRNMEMAVHWVKEVDIPADTKQDILEKLERVSLSLDRKDNKGLISHHKVTGGTPKAGAYSDYSAVRSLVSEPVETTDENRIKQQAFKEVDPQSLLRSFHLFSPFMELISGWMASSSVDYSLHASRWHKVLTVVSQRKATFSGAATVFLMIALYKQRLNLSRVLGGFGKVLGNLLRAIYIGVFDLWQLAFNVQLNPLAAVQPMPSSYYVR